MLTVLALAAFLLVVMPATLLWFGKMIAENTGGRLSRGLKLSQAANPPRDPSQVSWFRRPMRPAFAKPKAD